MSLLFVKCLFVVKRFESRGLTRVKRLWSYWPMWFRLK